MPDIEQKGYWLNNAAALIDASGAFLMRYNKIHLVPFGEFNPFEKQFPWLRDRLPPIGDFMPGSEFTVFNLPIQRLNSNLKFSTLICFEDVFPELARRFVREGAQVLIVITNDAWFGPTAAAYQHAQASIFRAVENRVSVVRAANTGWSGCIDAFGIKTASVKDEANRELFIDGFQTCKVSTERKASLYLLWGDWLAGICLVGTFSGLLAQGLFQQKQ